MKKKFLGFLNAYTQGKSGGDICFLEIVKGLDGFKKTIITSQMGKELCQENNIEARYLITTKERIFQQVILTYLARLIKACLLVFRVRLPDVIYSSSDFLPDVIPALMARMMIIRGVWIQKIHHLIPEERLIPSLAQEVSLFLIRRFADKVIVVNPLLKEELRRRGFKRAKLIVNPNGVNNIYFSRIRYKAGFTATFLARLHPSKGIYDLVDIWARVCEQMPRSRLAIVGHGPPDVVAELEDRIKARKLSNNIKLYGYLKDDEAYEILKGSKVFVFPSHEEGFGIAILEAMACGVPVVAYDLPVYREFFGDKINVVPVGATQEFADKIISLITDKAYWLRRHKESLAKAKEFDIARTIEKEKQLIDKII